MSFNNELVVDLDDLVFDAHGRQIGITIPTALLDEISGGRIANGECGTRCQGSDNKMCGNQCAV